MAYRYTDKEFNLIDENNWQEVLERWELSFGTNYESLIKAYEYLRLLCNESVESWKKVEYIGALKLTYNLYISVPIYYVFLVGPNYTPTGVDYEDPEVVRGRAIRSQVRYAMDVFIGERLNYYLQLLESPREYETREEVIEFWKISLDDFTRSTENYFGNFKLGQRLEKFFNNSNTNDIYNAIVYSCYSACNILVNNKPRTLRRILNNNESDFIDVVGIERYEEFRKAIFNELNYRLVSEQMPGMSQRQRLAASNLNVYGDPRDFLFTEQFLNPEATRILINSDWDNVGTKLNRDLENFKIYKDVAEYFERFKVIEEKQTSFEEFEEFKNKVNEAEEVTNQTTTKIQRLQDEALTLQTEQTKQAAEIYKVYEKVGDIKVSTEQLKTKNEELNNLINQNKTKIEEEKTKGLRNSTLIEENKSTLQSLNSELQNNKSDLINKISELRQKIEQLERNSNEVNSSEINTLKEQLKETKKSLDNLGSLTSRVVALEERETTSNAAENTSSSITPFLNIVDDVETFTGQFLNGYPIYVISKTATWNTRTDYVLARDAKDLINGMGWITRQAGQGQKQLFAHIMKNSGHVSPFYIDKGTNQLRIWWDNGNYNGKELRVLAWYTKTTDTPKQNIRNITLEDYERLLNASNDEELTSKVEEFKTKAEEALNNSNEAKQEIEDLQEAWTITLTDFQNRLNRLQSSQEQGNSLPDSNGFKLISVTNNVVEYKEATLSEDLEELKSKIRQLEFDVRENGRFSNNNTDYTSKFEYIEGLIEVVATKADNARIKANEQEDKINQLTTKLEEQNKRLISKNQYEELNTKLKRMERRLISGDAEEEWEEIKRRMESMSERITQNARDIEEYILENPKN